MTSSVSEPGKIRHGLLKEVVFPLTGASRQEVIIGPSYGVDVSMVSLGNGMAMLMTSDPLSLIPTLGLRESAWLSVHLMANDMATTGFAPQYGQFVMNLPTTLKSQDFEEYWGYIHEFCSDIGVAITGGHTGRFEGLNSTVCGGGTFISTAPAAKVITSKGARPGDILVMTKTSALVATSILARSFPKTVGGRLGMEVLEKVSGLFYETSALQAGLVASELNSNKTAVTAMHDVTECGVLGAVFEMAKASNVGAEIHYDKIPVTDEQRAVCDLFQVDPHFCVGAGSMLMAVDSSKIPMVIKTLGTRGIRATEIGRIIQPSQGLYLRKEEGVEHLVHPGVDPYWNAFHSALKQGWR